MPEENKCRWYNPENGCMNHWIFSQECDYLDSQKGCCHYEENKKEPVRKYTSSIEWTEMFTARIRAEMKAKSISQQELSDKIGMPEDTLSRFINGTRVPRGPAIVRIAEGLGCSIGYLMGE